MSTPELPAEPVQTVWPYIERSVARILRTIEELDHAEVNWRPLPSGNSLYVIATHVLGNVEESILGTLCGQAVHRERDAEFLAEGESVGPLATRWTEVRERIDAALEQLAPDALTRTYPHPRRGELTGLDILLVVARHAAEHVGEAELTRNLILDRRAAGT